MKACHQTQWMLRWWAQAQIREADLAIRRCTGVMLWQRGVSLHRLPLAWARAENVRGAEIYIRPARGQRWPLVFLDDVPTQMARRVARHYAALLVETSTEGGCHIWLRCCRSLSEAERRDAQRFIAARIGADRASTSGEHLGRLAGMKNHKRHGQWVNILQASSHRPPWQPSYPSVQSLPPRSLSLLPAQHLAPQQHEKPTTRGVDSSPSGKEWGFVLGALEAGVPPRKLYTSLLQRARGRRGADAHRYARRTLQRAMLRLGISEPIC